MLLFLKKEKRSWCKRFLFSFALLSASFLLFSTALFATQRTSSFLAEEVQENKSVNRDALFKKLGELKRQEKILKETLQRLKEMPPRAQSQDAQLEANRKILRQQLADAQSDLRPLQEEWVTMQRQIHQIEAQANDLANQARSVNSVASAQDLLGKSQELVRSAMQLAHSSQAKNLEAQIAGVQNRIKTSLVQLGQTSTHHDAVASRNRQLEMKIQQAEARLASVRQEIEEIERQLEAAGVRMSDSHEVPLSRSELEERMRQNPGSQKIYDDLSAAEQQFAALIDTEKDYRYEFLDRSGKLKESVKQMWIDLASGGAHFILGLPSVISKWIETNLELLKRGDDIFEIANLDWKSAEKMVSFAAPKLLALACAHPYYLAGVATLSFTNDLRMAHKDLRQKIKEPSARIEADLAYQTGQREEIKAVPGDDAIQKIRVKNHEGIEKIQKKIQDNREALAKELDVPVGQIPRRVDKLRIENHLVPTLKAEGMGFDDSSVVDMQEPVAVYSTVPLLRKNKD
ncbi:MAG: hypothetical protein EXS63_02070 [Candidatus Omnitrophica bacterium]|nr:hypothetical protein [Candidatus Omnitrophota bacterium]